jgi:hypothetical protein
MKRNYFKKIFIVGFLFLSTAGTARAAIVTCGNGDSGNVSEGCTFNDLFSSSVVLVDYLFAAAAVVAVGGVVFAGYKMLTSAGNSSKQEEGKKALINSIIGLAIILLSVLLVSSLKGILGYKEGPLIEYTATQQPVPNPIDQPNITPPPVAAPVPVAVVPPVTPPSDNAPQPSLPPPVAVQPAPPNQPAPSTPQQGPLQKPSPMQNVLSWVDEHCDLLATATADNIRDLMRGIPNAGALRGHGIF